MSDLADPKEQALFMILVEHDILVDNRRQVGVLYVGCPECGAEPNADCVRTERAGQAVRNGPPAAPAPHFARLDLRQRTLPDLSDIHIKTRKRIRDLFDHDVCPEDLLT